MYLESDTINYHADYPALEKTAVTAIEAGQRVVLSLDSLETLSMGDMRSLVKLLRRSRAIGGEVVLRTGKPEIRKVLAVTAFDRIFTVLDNETAA